MNKLHFKGPFFEFNAAGTLAVIAATCLVALLIVSGSRAWFQRAELNGLITKRTQRTFGRFKSVRERKVTTMADTKWLYSIDGKPVYYQNGKYLYSAYNSACDYYYGDEGKYIHSMNGGTPSFYRHDKWIYTMSGEPKYYYG